MNPYFHDDEEHTEVRSYTKSELALLYSPGGKYESAIRRFNRYLHRCAPPPRLQPLQPTLHPPAGRHSLRLPGRTIEKAYADNRYAIDRQ